MNPTLTLCFLIHGEEVLMLHRRFPPNQGLWNGVGGHIKPGETPTQAIIREVAEETGYQIANPQFSGLVTWDGFETPPGVIAVFKADVPHKNFVTNHEGELAWKPLSWACADPEVVDNIHVFLPNILAGERLFHYHFSYQDGIRVATQVSALPEDFILERPFQQGAGISEEQRGDFLLSFDKDRLQLPVITDLLPIHSCWAYGKEPAAIERAIQQSVCIGVYHHGVQVAFARLVTDQASFAWLCDISLADEGQGLGLEPWIVEAACRYCDTERIDHILTVTKDFAGLDLVYGEFKPLQASEKLLHRRNPNASS